MADDLYPDLNTVGTGDLQTRVEALEEVVREMVRLRKDEYIGQFADLLARVTELENP